MRPRTCGRPMPRNSRTRRKARKEERTHEMPCEDLADPGGKPRSRRHGKSGGGPGVGNAGPATARLAPEEPGAECRMLEEAESQLGEYFRGARDRFDLP